MKKRLIFFTTLFTLLFIITLGITLPSKSESANATTPVSATEGLSYNGESTDFTVANPYAVETSLTSAPKTFEALIKVKTNTLLPSGKYGIVMGNFYSSDASNNDCFDIFVENNGNPRFYWHNAFSGSTDAGGQPLGFDWKISSVSLNTNKWTHIAFVRDTTADKTYFYLNGVLTDTYNDAGADMIPGSLAGSNSGALKIGMDSRTNSRVTQTFQGSIAYASLSATAKTAQEINASMNAMVDQSITKEGNATKHDSVLFVAPHSYYKATKKFSATPNTITATFRIPKDYSIATAGTILGNYSAGASYQAINLEINENGNLMLVWNKTKGGANYDNAQAKVEFRSTDFRTGEWENIAVVRDAVAGAFKLFVNGAFVEKVTASTGSDITGTYAPVLANNQLATGAVRSQFRGQIKDLAVFSSPLSASKINNFYLLSDKTTATKADYPSMMINWVLSSAQQDLFYNPDATGNLEDHSGNDNDAFLCSMRHYYDPVNDEGEKDDNWLTAQKGEYTMIFMPDTQVTVQRDIDYYESDPTVNSVADLDMTKTFQWMVDNAKKMNLSFVMHMGDLKQSRGVTNNWGNQNDWREWQLISGYTSINPSFTTGNTSSAPVKGFSSDFINGQTYGFGLLREAGIPYTTILGNHDYDNFNTAAGTGRSADYYNHYFSSAIYDDAFPKTVVARYNNNVSAWSKNNDTMMNAIYEIDASPRGSSTPVKYLVVALEFGPDDDMLAWANSVISNPKYASHRVITTTHSLMYLDGEFMGPQSYCRPINYGYANDPFIQVNDGIDVWNKLISKHQNSFLSAGGHISQESFVSRVDIGDNGNQVLSLLVDFQDMYNAGGDSIVVVAKVNEQTKKITFKAYNPVIDKFYNVENQMEYTFSDTFIRKIEASTDVKITATSAKAGDTINFELKATKNYFFSPVVKDAKGNVITAQNNNGSYSFVMPDSNVSITVDRLAKIKITLPKTLTINANEQVDLAKYLPNGYKYEYALSNDCATLSSSTLTGAKEGSTTLTVTAKGFGEIASCSITVASSPEETPTTDKKDSGCKSSASALSAILTFMTLIGASLILKK